MFADLILAGGAVYPLGRAGLRARSHLAIAGGVVIALGGSEVMDLRGPRTRVHPLDGGAVLPGFNDAHAHVVYHGLSSFGADLTGCRTIPELLARLHRTALRLPPGEWCLGRGWATHELAEGRPPDRLELDSVTGGRPTFVDERGGHSRVANSAALAAAGLGPGSPDPPGGRLGRDPGGSLDGLLAEAAMRLVADVQPPPSLGRRREGILRSQRLLLSRGITSVGAAVNRGFAADLHAFHQLEAEGRLRVRVNEFLSWELLDALDGLGIAAGFGGRMLRAGPVKVFVDGGAGRGAAAMRSGPGTWRTTPDDLRTLLSRAQRAGLQVAAHAIGDAAIEAFLDAVEAAGPEARLKRHRVEHCTVCPPDLRRRAAALGVVAVMQPQFAIVAAERMAAAFESDVRDHVAPHRELLEAGVPLAFSSDLPVSGDPNPWPGLAAAVAPGPHAIPVRQALAAYTLGGAYTSFEERFKGTLEPGMVADFQVYAEDPLKLGPGAWTAGLRPRLVALGGALSRTV